MTPEQEAEHRMLVERLRSDAALIRNRASSLDVSGFLIGAANTIETLLAELTDLRSTVEAQRKLVDKWNALSFAVDYESGGAYLSDCADELSATLSPKE